VNDARRLAETLEPDPNCCGVRRSRGFLEVALEVGAGFPVATEVLVDHAAIPVPARARGVEMSEQIDDEERGRIVAMPDMNRTQIHQHAGENGAPVGRMTQQGRRLPLALRDPRALKSGAEFGDGEPRTTERVDDSLAVPDQKMPGCADPGGVLPEPGGDGEVEDREGDRNAATTFDHMVQTAVADVVIIRFVAAKAELPEEQVGEHDGIGTLRLTGSGAVGGPLRDAIDPAEKIRDVDIGTFERGNPEGTLGEVAVGVAGDLRELCVNLAGLDGWHAGEVTTGKPRIPRSFPVTGADPLAPDCSGRTSRQQTRSASAAGV
jgi:hypothetical protein